MLQKATHLPLVLLYATLFALFWQTRISFFGGQIVDYLIPFLYFSDVLVFSFLATLVFFDRQAFWRFACQPALRKVHFWAALFWLLAFFSNLKALYALAAWYKWLKLILFYGFAVGLAYVISLKKETRLKAFFFLNTGLILQALIAFGEVLVQRSLGWQILGEWRFSVLTPGIAKVFLGGHELLRPYATFPHPNVLGGVMAVMAAVNGFFFLHRQQNRFYLICFLLFSLIAFLSFSRSAWVAYLAMVSGVFFYWIWRKKGCRLSRLNPKIVGPVVIAAFILLPLAWSRFQTLLTVDQLSVERRWELVLVALTMLKNNLFLGAGLNQFVPSLEHYALISGPDRFLQPVHNVLLLILTEHGLLGFMTFLGFVLSVVRSASVLVLVMWLGVLTITFFDHYFWSLQAGQLFFWLIVGLSLENLVAKQMPFG